MRGRKTLPMEGEANRGDRRTPGQARSWARKRRCQAARQARRDPVKERHYVLSVEAMRLEALRRQREAIQRYNSSRYYY